MRVPEYDLESERMVVIITVRFACEVFAACSDGPSWIVCFQVLYIVLIVLADNRSLMRAPFFGTSSSS